MNWKNQYNRMLSQSKIIEAIYSDELFEFMTFTELQRETKLSKPTLWYHLRELCDERGREGRMNLEVYEALNRIESGKLKGEDRHRLLKHPTLLTKHGVYRLHPTTKWAMDRGIYPYIIRKGDRERALKLMMQRRGNRPERSHSRLETEDEPALH